VDLLLHIAIGKGVLQHMPLPVTLTYYQQLRVCKRFLLFPRVGATVSALKSNSTIVKQFAHIFTHGQGLRYPQTESMELFGTRRRAEVLGAQIYIIHRANKYVFGF